MKRRQYLHSLGIVGGLALTPGLGTAQRNSPTFEELDTGFDPTDSRQTGRFVVGTFKRTEGASASETNQLRREIHQSLTRGQVEAIAKFLQENASLKSEQKIGAKPVAPAEDLPEGDASSDEGSPRAQMEGRVGSKARTSYDYTVSTEIEITWCPYWYHCRTDSFHAYDYTHELSWGYDGETVERGSHSSQSESNGYEYAIVRWLPKSDADLQIWYHSDNLYVAAYRKGHFVQEMLIGGAVDKHQYPEIELMGDNAGRGNATEIDPK